MIFASAPSAEQWATAEKHGLHLKMIPVAKEAFVFLVNRKNPVNSLTIKQIQAIYSGTLTDDWSALSGNRSRILAFQRPIGSSSQQIMINSVMGDKPIKAPLAKEFRKSPMLMKREVAIYRNVLHAIGYSFRFYVLSMKQNSQVKLLAVNGVEPIPENISSGRYPVTVDVYMVTARPISENTLKLIDWFLSEQGQQLVEDVGYVPIRQTIVSTDQ